MATFKGADITAPVDTFSTGTTDQMTALGSKQQTEDGRIFRYCKNGAVATVAGSLYQGPVPLANHLANTPPAVAIGATSFAYTPGATAGAASLYAEGYMQVDTTPGEGYTYQVDGHAAITSSVAFTLYLKDPIQVALTTSSRVGLIPNQWKNIVVAPTTLTANVAGWAAAVVGIGLYAYVQTGGPVSALINGTPAITAPVINSATTAGAVDVWTTAAQATSALVGHMMQVGVSAKLNFVYAQIDS